MCPCFNLRTYPEFKNYNSVLMVNSEAQADTSSKDLSVTGNGLFRVSTHMLHHKNYP